MLICFLLFFLKILGCRLHHKLRWQNLATGRDKEAKRRWGIPAPFLFCLLLFASPHHRVYTRFDFFHWHTSVCLLHIDNFLEVALFNLDWSSKLNRHKIGLSQEQVYYTIEINIFCFEVLQGCLIKLSSKAYSNKDVISLLCKNGSNLIFNKHFIFLFITRIRLSVYGGSGGNL